MPDQKLTQLPVLAALSADDIFYVVDDPAGAASSRQVATSVFDARYLQTANNLSDLTNAVVARASLGLGTLAVINSPLPIINGGSGQVTQQAAIDALTNVAAATNEHVLTKDTATGNAIWKVTAVTLPVADTQTIVKGSADATKLLRFEVDGFTAGATRVLTPPNQDATIAGLEVTQTFTAPQTFEAAANPAIFLTRTDIAKTWSFGRIDALNNFLIRNDTDSMTIMSMKGSNGEVSITDGLFIVNRVSGTGNIIHNLITLNNSFAAAASAGFGAGIKVSLKSSTTASRDAGRLAWAWSTATDATRKARSTWTVYDTAEREAIRIEADGAAAMIGLLGATPIARPAAYTLASTATRTMPTPEAAFTGIDNAQVGAVYAQVADLLTLQTRLNNVEGVLRQVIIDLASTSGFGFLAAA